MAGTPRYYVLPQKDIHMRVPETVRKCVLTLGCKDEGELKYLGTICVISVPGALKEWSATYLVTAKHCLREIGNKPAVIRGNTKDAKSIEMDATGIHWFSHPDPLVDVAVTPFLPPFVEILDFRTLPISMFLAAEDIENNRIGAGDEVFMTGLFTKVKGQSRNLPIVRMGSVALICEEKIPWKDDLIDAYLIESRSIGGLSGSPTFVSETVQVPYFPKRKGNPIGGAYYWAPGQTFFMGIVIGHWDAPPMRSLLEIEKVNMGISVVVPAWKILEVLNLPEQLSMRKEAETLALERDGIATNDSSLESSEPKEVFTKEDFDAALKKASRRITPKN